MHTCAFSLSIFMSFLYTTINERLVVGQGRVPLTDVAHTGTRCAPVPSRFLSDAHLWLLAFYLHVLILQNQKRKMAVTQGRDATRRF